MYLLSFFSTNGQENLSHFSVNGLGQHITIRKGALKLDDKIITQLEDDFRISNIDEQLLIYQNGIVSRLEGDHLKDLYTAKSASQSKLSYFDEFTYVTCKDSITHTYDYESKILKTVYLSPEDSLVQVLKYKDEFAFLLNSKIIFQNLDTIGFTFKASDGLYSKDYGLFISSQNDGLWIYRGGQLKRFFIPSIRFPEKISDLKLIGQQLFIHSSTDELFLFNLDSQILNNVGQGIDFFDLDMWNTIWYCKNQKIGFNSQFINDELPIAFIQSVNYMDNVLLDTELELKKHEDLIAELGSFYIPDKNLNYEWRSNLDGVWKSCEPNFRLSYPGAKLSKIEWRCHSGGLYSQPVSLRLIEKYTLLNNVWFYIFFGLLIAIALLLIGNFRVRSRENALKKEKEKLNLKLQLATSLQRYDQLKMNPHFVFNALNGINGMIAISEYQKARKAISKFSQLMRSVLNQSSEEKIALKDELSFLENYLQLEQLILGDKFEYEINAESINGEIYPMLIQPLIENAIKHGIQAQNDKGLIIVEVHEIPKYFRIIIKDSGPGFDPLKSVGDKHLSKATGIIKQRLNAIDKWKLYPLLKYSREETKFNNFTVCTLYIPKS